MIAAESLAKARKVLRARADSGLQVDTFGGGGSQSQMPMSPRGTAVGIEWAVEFGKYTQRISEERCENYKDFYFKYEGGQVKKGDSVRVTKDGSNYGKAGVVVKNWSGSSQGLVKVEVGKFTKGYDRSDLDTGAASRRPQHKLGQQRYQWCVIFDMVEKVEGADFVLSDECVEIMQRLAAANIIMEAQLSCDGVEIILQLGCSYEVFIEEANAMKPTMRLKSTLGSAEFSSEFIDYFATNRFQTIPIVFTSGMRQRLVWNRMARLAKINLEDREFMPNKDKCMKEVKNKIDKSDEIRGQELVELLSSHGAFRPNAEEIFGKGGRLIAEVAKAVLADSFFTVEPESEMDEEEVAMFKARQEHLMEKGEHVVTWDEVVGVVDILDKYCEVEPGKSEVFQGSLKMFFPRHNEKERAYLKQKWGSFHIMAQCYITGKSAEKWQGLTPHGQSLSVTYYQQPEDTKHFSWLWVPIDEIRDYFGDHVGMYTCWLVMYTKSLVWPAALGLIVYVVGNTEEATGGIRDSTESVWLIPYAMFLSLWSSVFLASWRSKESELSFLWGSEHFEETAPVRAEFRGNLQVNAETHVEKIVHASQFGKVMKVVISQTISISLMLLTAFVAFAVTLIQYYGRPSKEDTYCVDFMNNKLDDIDVFQCAEPDLFVTNATTGDTGPNTWVDGYEEGISFYDKNKYKFGSSFTNTIIILSFGKIFGIFADMLNDWENHRTQIQYDDNKIVKTFMFEFVNNYFLLFYFAFLRSLKDPWYGIDASCQGASCLPEVAFQLTAVFTTKTVIQQTMEILKPLIKTQVATIKHTLKLKKMKNLLTDTIEMGSSIVMTDEMKHEYGLDDNSRELKKQKQDREIELDARALKHSDSGTTGDAENGSYLTAYPNTMEDFEEMAIQFGYLALFSPAYPAAPLLAFLNNILEIRVDASNMCYTFQRPRWQACQDIGSWFSVLNVIGFISVVTNAAMMCFVGLQTVTVIDSLNGGQFPEETNLLMTNDVLTRFTSWKLWGWAMVFEHVVLMMRTGTLIMMPSKPRWVDEARELLHFRIANFQTSEELRETQELHQKYSNASSDPNDERTMEQRVLEKRQAKIEAKSAAAKGKPKSGDMVSNPMSRTESGSSQSPMSGSSPKGTVGKKTVNPMAEMEMNLNDDDDDADD